MANRCDFYDQLVSNFQHEPAIKCSDIVMLGDSLTEFGGNWNERLIGQEEGPFVNRGIRGDDAQGIFDRLNQITPFHPKAIFLLAGVNDISHNLTACEVADKVMDIARAIRRESPQTQLILQSMLPINEDFHQWLSMVGKTDTVFDTCELLKQKAAADGFAYLNLFPHFVLPDTHITRPEYTVDGLHLTEAGYGVWCKILIDCLTRNVLL